MDEYAVKVENLSKSFEDLQVLEKVNLEIKKGEIISIIGESGCGKSVLLRCINLLEVPDEGKIFLNGEELSQTEIHNNQIRRKIGMVYQNFNLFSHLNVLENLCLAPTKVLKMSHSEVEKKAREWLQILALSSVMNAMPDDLSWGQQQRVAIARCMMMEPEIIFLDEPTSALDPSMASEFVATMRMLNKRGITIIFITHKWELAKALSDRVFFMCDQTIYEQGTPHEIFDMPQKPKTIHFIQKVKYLHYTITRRDFDFIELQGQIIRFGEKYQFTPKLLMAIQLCVEELIVIALDTMVNPEKVHIHLLLSMQEENQMVQLELQIVGKEYNPFTDVNQMDNLGLLIVRKKSKEQRWHYENDTNVLKIDFDNMLQKK